MSTRYDGGPNYENHQRAAELHNLAAHAHRAAIMHHSGDHVSGHEHSRIALEHSNLAYLHSQATATFGDAETAELAYALWVKRGRPKGSSEEDWNHAVERLRARAEGR